MALLRWGECLTNPFSSREASLTTHPSALSAHQAGGRRGKERRNGATGGEGPAGLPQPTTVLVSSQSTPATPRRVSFQVYLARLRSSRTAPGVMVLLHQWIG